MSKVILGCEAKDKVTGFKGTVIGKSTWLTGCDQWCLKPKVGKDNKIYDGAWFDILQVVYVGPGFNKKELKDDKDPGGPQKDSPIR
ncbi:MAG: hypothetical protein ACUZ8H_01555 [Candidatus Anammoxibacter sp.]